MDVIYTPEQERAINAVTNLDHRIVGVSGPAGSGKTTIIREAVDQLTAIGRSVALAAPTGRAARRMYEATGIKSVTVHRLLEYGKPIIDPVTGEPYEEPGPSRHRYNPIPYDDVIVDEFAMVNWRLYRNLVDALRMRDRYDPDSVAARLLCFGDVAQLQPIEQHQIKTEDCTPFEKVLRNPNSVELTHVHRQAEGSGVLTNANLIRRGYVPKRTDDFNIVYYSMKGMQPVEAVTWFVKNAKEDYSKLQHQFITPSRNGMLGSRALNNAIQSVYAGPDHLGYELPRPKLPGKDKDKQTKYPCRVGIGEKVICNTNTYDMRDFFDRYEFWRTDVLPEWSSFIPVPDEFMMLNGETGIIVDIEPNGTLFIEMLDRTVQVPPDIADYNSRGRNLYRKDCRKELDLAYAITTHKMQGNEVDDVCLLLHRDVLDNATRNNIYTAITRARKSVTILTDESSLRIGIGRTPAMMDEIRERRKKNKGWSIGEG